MRGTGRTDGRIAAALLLAALAGGCHGSAPSLPIVHRHGRHQPAPGPGHIVVLPDSAILAQPGSVEEQLARYLASPAPAPRTFRFTGVEFAPWASRPNPPTLRTIFTLAQVLRAYPKAQVTLAGYTDDVGTPAQNVQLARARVERMATLLERGGIAPARIATEGRGAVDFLAGNATEADRARNRRIELTVTAK